MRIRAAPGALVAQEPRPPARTELGAQSDPGRAGAALPLRFAAQRRVFAMTIGNSINLDEH